MNISFHLTKALSGHGYFRAYLYKRTRVSTPYCLWCPKEEEDAKHTLTTTLFKCTKYTVVRTALTSRLGRDPTAYDVQLLLCGGERTRYITFVPLARNIECKEDLRRKLFVEMISDILKDKEEDKWRRLVEGRRASAATKRGTKNRRGERGRVAVPARGRNN